MIMSFAYTFMMGRQFSATLAHAVFNMSVGVVLMFLKIRK
jgi:hypothetical protein